MSYAYSFFIVSVVLVVALVLSGTTKKSWNTPTINPGTTNVCHGTD